MDLDSRRETLIAEKATVQQIVDTLRTEMQTDTFADLTFEVQTAMREHNHVATRLLSVYDQRIALIDAAINAEEEDAQTPRDPLDEPSPTEKE